MTWDIAKDVLIDSLKDSALVFAFVFLFYVIISFFEDKLARILTKKVSRGPIIGATFGLIPQCGTSVLGADLYIKKYISLGTIIALFLSCSDEAFIMLLTHPSEDTIYVLPLLALKFLIGFGVGILVDVIYKGQKMEVQEQEIANVTCEPHHHEHVKLHKHLLHPIFHSLLIFAYVLVINACLGLIIESVGKETFVNFISSNKYLSPLFACFVGLIPNCASSILITKLFIEHNLAFGAMVSGLLVNAGLGIFILLKNKSTINDAFIIIGISLVTAILVGYILCLILGF